MKGLGFRRREAALLCSVERVALALKRQGNASISYVSF
jgi:hypothetical protein